MFYHIELTWKMSCDTAKHTLATWTLNESSQDASAFVKGSGSVTPAAISVKIQANEG